MRTPSGLEPCFQAASCPMCIARLPGTSTPHAYLWTWTLLPGNVLPDVHREVAGNLNPTGASADLNLAAGQRPARCASRGCRESQPDRVSADLNSESIATKLAGRFLAHPSRNISWLSAAHVRPQNKHTSSFSKSALQVFSSETSPPLHARMIGSASHPPRLSRGCYKSVGIFPT